MEDKFYKDELESFIKEHADNYRMYPSDGVWRHISTVLHGPKTWPALTIAAFVLFIALVVISVRFANKPNIFAEHPAKATNGVAAANTTSPTSQFLLADNGSIASISNWKKSSNKESLGQSKQTSSIVQIDENALATTGVEIINNEDPIRPTTQPPTITKEEPIVDLQYVENLEKPTIPKIEATERIESAKRVLPLADNNPPFQLNFTKTKRRSSWKDKISYQVYIAPSVSYRKLRERPKDPATGEGPVALSQVADVHQIVRHKPGNGLEAGVAFMYNVSPRLRIKSGLQMNVRQYYIHAFKSVAEEATITLYNNGGIDTVVSIANYRTATGIEGTEITNRYFQIAVPIGLDLQVAGNRSFQLNIGASVQPTYQLNTNIYTLATNFKNYTQATDILQRWNINSSLEAYLSFKSGRYRWQVGPQIRYQHLPSMIPQYPIKEYLVDYGIKLGITRPLR